MLRSPVAYSACLASNKVAVPSCVDDEAAPLVRVVREVRRVEDRFERCSSSLEATERGKASVTATVLIDHRIYPDLHDYSNSDAREESMRGIRQEVIN